MNGPIHFPGSTAISDLTVYDDEDRDHPGGGAPHLHLVSSEAYVVQAGSGTLETLTVDGVDRYDLEAGTVLWFSPGTIHRLINDGGLRILTIMQNAGLPEAGDAVLTFPRGILADPLAYSRAAAIVQGDENERAASARARRDLALRGYEELTADIADRGSMALTDFYRLAGLIVAPKVHVWKALWQSTVEVDTELTRRQFERLVSGDTAFLHDASVATSERRAGTRLFGMCGRLDVWDPK